MEPKKLQSRHWIAIGLGTGLVCLTFLLLLSHSNGSLFSRKPPEQLVVISSGTVRPNDHLGKILTDRRVNPKFTITIEKQLKSVFPKDKRHIMEDETYEVVTTTDGVFLKFIYHTNPIQSYTVARSSLGVFESSANQQQTVWMERRVSGTITGFLWSDLQKQGLDENLVANLTTALDTSIFGWRIDFFTEQRQGDKYNILLEQEYIVGSSVPLRRSAHLRILAASYSGTGTKHKENVGIRYMAPGAKKADYYDPEGKALQKEFRRAPFSQSAGFRVSSRFNRNRFHPILRTYRPHHGTDYAAAKGTPVAAVGRGTVILAGWKGGYGNCVEVRHNSKYVSRYGHLSRIGVRYGQSVSQGQFLGNVGASGLATGPHLHFEMLVSGVQQDFLRMTFPSASSVAQKNMPDFERVRDELMARLNLGATPSS